MVSPGESSSKESTGSWGSVQTLSPQHRSPWNLEPCAYCTLSSAGFLHIIKTHPTLKIALEAAAERLGWGGTGLCQGGAV